MTTSVTTTTNKRIASRMASATAARLCSALLTITIIAHLCLSAHAIKCHQCNSHLDEDCIRLRLNTPGEKLDEQYLKECENHSRGMPFCRKTVIKIEATKEHRIVRSCGWINHDHLDKTNACYTADNEGYTQVICSCTEDGCNAATTRFAGVPVLVAIVSLISLVALLKRCSW